MLTLRLFGGLSLTDSERAVPTRATQRRRLVLLAILASAGRPLVTKDKLIAILWPDVERERARHLLADSLYVLRDALGGDLFQIAGDSVALNPARISSDIEEFRSALDAGDPVHAVQVHGPQALFLEGVHLPGAVEFEHWVDAKHAEISLEYQRALETLATAATRRGDLEEAVSWRRRLAAESPLSSSAAIALLRALGDAGDLPGAIAFGRLHEQLVKAELDCEPDARIVELTDTLRARHARSAASRVPQPLAARVPAVAEAAASATLRREDVQPATVPVVTQHERSDQPSGWGWPAVVAAAVGLGLTFGAWAWRPGRAPAEKPSPAMTVAIVPFATVGRAGDGGSFAASATENLVHMLATSHRVRVMTTTANGQRATPGMLRRVGESLHVAQLIDGDVTRSGDRVRVNVRLIDAGSGYARWTGSYERESKDVLGLQEDIGRAVAAALRLGQFGDGGASRARHGTSNLAAYDRYLSGRHLEELRSDTGYRAAVDAYRAAIDMDSGFAAAYAGLAEAYVFTGVAGDYGHFPPRATARKAEAAALKAVALDDSLGEAHFALGVVRLAGVMDLGEAERQLRRALALNPADTRNREFLSIVYAWTGRPDAAVREARELVDANPLSVVALRELGNALLVARRYDEALAQLERARTLGPPVRAAYRMEGEVYAAQGRYPEALAVFRLRSEPLTRAMLAHTLARSGNPAAARRMLHEFTDLWRAERGGAFEVFVVYAGLDDYDDAFEWLNRAVEDHSISGRIMDPMFDDVRADPRFAAIQRRILGQAS